MLGFSSINQSVTYNLLNNIIFVHLFVLKLKKIQLI
jgi:hypothetical protein